MPKTAAKVAPSDYHNLIRQGIEDAKGSPDEALKFLTRQDLMGLGRMLAEREARKDGLFSMVIDPIDDMAVGIEMGKFTKVEGLLIEYLKGMLDPAPGPKRVYFVPVTENIIEGEEEVYLNQFDLGLCKQAPNYLMGAMVLFSKSKLPKEVLSQTIVAIGHDPSSIFESNDVTMSGDFKNHLSVSLGGQRKVLRLRPVNSKLDKYEGLIILGERIE